MIRLHTHRRCRLRARHARAPDVRTARSSPRSGSPTSTRAASCRTSTSPRSSRPLRPPPTAPTGSRRPGAARTARPTTPPTPRPPRTRRSSRSSTRSPPTARTASRAGATPSRPTSRSSSASSAPRTAARRPSASTWARAAAPQYVDIQIVPLPGPRSAYADNFSAISGAVQRALGSSSTPRNAVVIADGLAGGRRSTASARRSWAAPARSRAPRTCTTAAASPRSSSAATAPPRPAAARWGWWPEGFLHEMTHNLGAVQWGAPHSTQPRGGSAPNYGHCWQGADVMCYVEDARRGARDAGRLRGSPRRDPAELRLRPRRLLQPRPRGRQLPRDALEHVRLGVPRALRRDRPGLRRRRAVGAAGAGRDRLADDRRRAAPRLDADGRQRRVEQRPDRLQPTSGSASPPPAGRTSTPRPTRPTWSRATTSAAVCA